MKRYNIEITYFNDEERQNIYLISEDIESSMVEYQRNREPFKWRILHFQLILESGPAVLAPVKPPKPPKPARPKKPKKPSFFKKPKNSENSEN